MKTFTDEIVNEAVLDTGLAIGYGRIVDRRNNTASVVGLVAASKAKDEHRISYNRAIAILVADGFDERYVDGVEVGFSAYEPSPENDVHNSFRDDEFVAGLKFGYRWQKKIRAQEALIF